MYVEKILKLVDIWQSFWHVFWLSHSSVHRCDVLLRNEFACDTCDLAYGSHCYDSGKLQCHIDLDSRNDEMSDWHSQIANWHHKRMTWNVVHVQMQLSALSFSWIASSAQTIIVVFCCCYNKSFFLNESDNGKMMGQIVSSCVLNTWILYGGLCFP